MNCPHCNHADHVEVDTHADGFAANLQECGHCGSVWTTTRGQKVVMLHGATCHHHGTQSQAECPICHSTDQVQVDIHADGYAHNLEECGVCGALWSQDQDQVRIVHGATWA